MNIKVKSCHILLCATCGTEFVSKNRQVKTCCEECKKIRNRKIIEKRNLGKRFNLDVDTYFRMEHGIKNRNIEIDKKLTESHYTKFELSILQDLLYIDAFTTITEIDFWPKRVKRNPFDSKRVMEGKEKPIIQRFIYGEKVCKYYYICQTFASLLDWRYFVCEHKGKQCPEIKKENLVNDSEMNVIELAREFFGEQIYKNLLDEYYNGRNDEELQENN